MLSKLSVDFSELKSAATYGVFVYGTGGHARVVYTMLDPRTPVVFVDDNPKAPTLGPGMRPVLTDKSGIPTGSWVIPAIGDNHAREKVVEQLKNQDRSLIIKGVRHVTAYSDIPVPEDAQVCAKAVIITGTQMGRCVIVNTGATVDHDCVLGDFVHVAPGVHLCGNVHVGHSTIVGVGSCARPGVKIGSNTVIGAGSVIVSDIPSNVVAFGNPCKVIKEIE